MPGNFPKLSRCGYAFLFFSILHNLLHLRSVTFVPGKQRSIGTYTTLPGGGAIATELSSGFEIIK